MEEKKEKMHPFFKLLLVLFIVFIAFNIALESGYYPTRLEKKTVIVNSELKRFEDDVKKGKEIKEGNYIEKEIDYSNFVTKSANTITKSLAKIFVEGSKNLGEIFKVMFG